MKVPIFEARTGSLGVVPQSAEPGPDFNITFNEVVNHHKHAKLVSCVASFLRVHIDSLATQGYGHLVQ